MNLENIKTPGVYINEVNAIPNPTGSLATAIPAFIGYTPQASYNGKPYTNEPVSIGSLADFEAFFCLPAPAKQYDPQYYLIEQESEPADCASLQLNDTWYAALPDPGTIYYLWNSVRLFYLNGGEQAYIVSVGGYGAPSGIPLNVGDPLVNPNVKVNDLINGLKTLQQQQDVTMYVCPDATLLSAANNSTLIEQMLLQSSTMQTSVSIVDVTAGRRPVAADLTNDITVFRENIGTNGLDYGAAYYPFLITSVMQSGEIDYTNFFGGDFGTLAAILNPPLVSNPAVAAVIATIENPATPASSAAKNNEALLAASPAYQQITQLVFNELNTLPPSAAMAGIITITDRQTGPWQAPANMSPIAVTALTINLTDTQQSMLNVDPVSGKSIDAFRFFNGQGVLVWGARTLDGNSNDWKYLPTRRTAIYIEQSCKLALNQYVFEANDQNTWQAVISTVSSFLNSLWQQGGLQGTKPADAYVVACGLGSTMTSQDLLEGLLIVSVQVAIVRPAEFVVITIQQQMATSS